MKPTPEFIDALTKSLVDSGQLIEAGWVGFKIAVKLQDAPAEQLHEMRGAFFSGALHVFTSVMSVLEPCAEPTAKDMERMSAICDELKGFQKELEARVAAIKARTN